LRDERKAARAAMRLEQVAQCNRRSFARIQRALDAEYEQLVDARAGFLQGQRDRHADALGLGVVDHPGGLRMHLEARDIGEIGTVVREQSDGDGRCDRLTDRGARLRSLDGGHLECVGQHTRHRGVLSLRRGGGERRCRVGLPAREIGRRERGDHPCRASRPHGCDERAPRRVDCGVVAAPRHGPVCDRGRALVVRYAPIELIDMDVVGVHAHAQLLAVRAEACLEPDRQQEKRQSGIGVAWIDVDAQASDRLAQPVVDGRELHRVRGARCFELRTRGALLLYTLHIAARAQAGDFGVDPREVRVLRGHRSGQTIAVADAGGDARLQVVQINGEWHAGLISKWVKATCARRRPPGSDSAAACVRSRPRAWAR
jgi:hypothetical protein